MPLKKRRNRNILISFYKITFSFLETLLENRNKCEDVCEHVNGNLNLMSFSPKRTGRSQFLQPEHPRHS
jgi:hypothetical protein